MNSWTPPSLIHSQVRSWQQVGNYFVPSLESHPRSNVSYQAPHFPLFMATGLPGNSGNVCLAASLQPLGVLACSHTRPTLFNHLFRAVSATALRSSQGYLCLSELMLLPKGEVRMEKRNRAGYQMTASEFPNQLPGQTRRPKGTWSRHLGCVSLCVICVSLELSFCDFSDLSF